MRCFFKKTSKDFGKNFCRAVFLCLFVLTTIATTSLAAGNRQNQEEPILAVVGDNHEDLASLLKAIEQAKALGATHFLITGDAIKGDAKDISRMTTLSPSQATIRRKVFNHRLQLSTVLEQVAAHAGVEKSRIFFLKGNYEDWGYFHDAPLLVRRASDAIISQYVTPVYAINEDRPVHDDELGIIEIVSGATGIVYRLAASHKPLVQLPYDRRDLGASLVQPQLQQTNFRNWFRRKAELREPDTKTTMRYDAEGKVVFPSGVMAYLFGHTHIAGGFYHRIKAGDEVRILPALNSGSANPTKKPGDQHTSFMLVHLAGSRATWHDIDRDGLEIKSWKLGADEGRNIDNGSGAVSHRQACMRVMRDVGATLSLFTLLKNKFTNLMPKGRNPAPIAQ